jgi:hypothetical protein
MLGLHTQYDSLGASLHAMVNKYTVAKESSMNCSIATADRATHLKIVVVAFLCSMALLCAAIIIH